jgi:hypothetical protein
MSNLVRLSGICILLFLGSCNIVKPFFIKNKKKEARKEKREIKKEARKEDRVIDSTVVVKKDSLILPSFDTNLVRKVIQNVSM